MNIDIITLFPDFFNKLFSVSIIGRAQAKGLVQIKTHQLRHWAIDKHGTVDDRPFGGGVGMILRPEPLFAAVEAIRSRTAHIVFLTPQGKTFTQAKASQLSRKKHLILICGHYEGVDQRVRDKLIDEEISIGDYVLTGGEIPAMVVTDAVVRLVPGVLEKPEAVTEESFVLKDDHGRPLLEYPQYTRPADFRGLKVPEVLLSGNHGEIEKWKKSHTIPL